jgi:hypothetical protein
MTSQESSLGDLEGAFSGERVFILGNGPSLAETPLERLDAEYTIAMNDIDTVFGETAWRPSFYLDIRVEPWDEHMVEVVHQLHESGTKCILRDSYKGDSPDLGEAETGVSYVAVTDIPVAERRVDRAIDTGEHQAVWAERFAAGLYRQHSSIYTAANIADILGFSELYFVGCDLYPEYVPIRYPIFAGGADPRTYDADATVDSPVAFLRVEGTPVRSLVNGIAWKLLRRRHIIRPLHRLSRHLGRLRPSHVGGFHHPDDIYTLGTNTKLERVHRAIRSAGELRGFTTYNATIGGRLEVYDRVDIHAVLG